MGLSYYVGMYKSKKKAILKKTIKDGMGGPGRMTQSSDDAAYLAPFKNAYYKRAKASGAFDRIAKLTGLGASQGGKYPKSRQEALDQLSGN